MGVTATQLAFFAQHEYQVKPRLTLSYGVRWQVLPSFHEGGGNLANFDQYDNSIVVPDELAAYLQKENIESSNIAFQPRAPELGEAVHIRDLNKRSCLDFSYRKPCWRTIDHLS